ncbi:MAG: hypothetical protein AB7O55_04045 [Lautropia sp.]
MISTFGLPSAPSPAIRKSIRLEVCGNWYSIATPASDGISSSPSTRAISISEFRQAWRSPGPAPWPVAATKCRPTISSMSSRQACWRNCAFVAW